MPKTIIGLGGGGFTSEPNNPLLDLYIVASAQKKCPKICFLPTASGDDENYINYFGQVFDQYPCDPSYLNVVSPRISDMEDFLLSHDIIYVGGGNTRSMLALWREWGIDTILKKAYEQGVVLAGTSAGYVCWFDECVSDAKPHKFSVVKCLGLLTESACPHYNVQKGRPGAYHDFLARGLINKGYAADDNVGLHFVDGKLLRAVASGENSNAYYLDKNEAGETFEEVITPVPLWEKDNFDKHIMYLFEGMSLEPDVLEIEQDSRLQICD